MLKIQNTQFGKNPGFLVRILFFVLICIVFDFLIGYVMQRYYYQQNSGWLYRTTYAIDSTKDEMLIFGASRANHHYRINTIKKKLHMSAYNTGRDGNAIFYHYAVLKSVLQRYTPKIAILDCSHGEFMKNQDSYDRISSLLPYYNDHPEIRSIVQLKSPFEKYKLMSGIYPYNSLFFQIAAGNSASNRTRQNRNDDNGYVPLFKSWNGALTVDSTLDNYEMDTLKIKYFRLFVKDCFDAHIKLFIILSPCYLRFQKVDASVVVIQQISKEFHVPFYDFSKEPVFLSSPSLYADESHLNDAGARLYTSKVIDRMVHDYPGYFTTDSSKHKSR